MSADGGPARPYKPHNYQFDAAWFLAGRERSNIFMPPGMGKTATVFDWHRIVKPRWTLIVAPWLVVRETWVKEAAKWLDFQHLTVTPIIGTPEERRNMLLAPPEIACINPQLLAWLDEELGNHWPWEAVVFDESCRLQGYRTTHRPKGDVVPHQLIQRPPRERRPYMGRGKSTVTPFVLSKYAHDEVKWWINLTGTPNANSYRQLWGPQWFIDAGRSLGLTYGDYIKRWFKPENPKDPSSEMILAGDWAAPQILEKIRPSSFTVKGEDWFDLLKPVHRTIHFDLTAKARGVYNDMRKLLEAEVEKGKVTAFNAGVKANKLRQIASGAVYHDDGETYSIVHDTRLDLVESILEELSGANLLVVTRFRHELHQLKKRFPWSVEVHEPDAIRRWNENKIRMLILHAASAGHGINLQHGGHHICFYAPYSDNELYSQVIERLGPIRQAQAGYNRPVYMHHLEAERTVDQRTVMVRERRVDELTSLIGALSD